MSRICRITYGSRVIDFTRYPYKMTPPGYDRVTLSHQSISGIDETLNVRADVSMDLAVRHLLNREEPYITLKRHLKQFKLWATQGHAWNLAMDSTDTVLTTLSAVAMPGDAVLTVTSASGIVAGRSYVLRNEYDLEVVKVTNVVGTSLTLAEGINYPFFNGDRFRSELYWPARLIDKRQPLLIENTPLWYDFEIRFMEDLNSL